jgi:SPP1 gp7 family putative phage head morphogenesis protein
LYDDVENAATRRQPLTVGTFPRFRTRLEETVAAWAVGVMGPALQDAIGDSWLRGQGDCDTVLGLAYPSVKVPAMDTGRLTLLRSLMNEHLARYGADVQSKIASVMLRGLMSGNSATDMMREVERILGLPSGRGIRYEAERIVRTEMTRAYNMARQARREEYGKQVVGLYKVWLSWRDNRVRPAHRAADGQMVPYDQPFKVAGELLMFPGDPKGSAAQTVNCRCSAPDFKQEWAPYLPEITGKVA